MDTETKHITTLQVEAYVNALYPMGSDSYKIGALLAIVQGCLNDPKVLETYRESISKH
jgi:hypothetical protein